jgi:hypothetical protein
MNILITILIIIAAIISLLLLVALFTKKQYAVERNIIINKPVGDVFNYIRHLKNQDYYSKWVMTDPGMQRKFTGADGAKGFIYGWDSKNKQAGAGEQEIMQITENKRLDIEVRFLRPFKAVGNTPFTTESIDTNKTKVTWGMNSTMKYPMNIMLVVMNMEKMLGKDITTSLNNLKVILEH